MNITELKTKAVAIKDAETAGNSIRIFAFQLPVGTIGYNAYSFTAYNAEGLANMRIKLASPVKIRVGEIREDGIYGYSRSRDAYYVDEKGNRRNDRGYVYYSYCSIKWEDVDKQPELKKAVEDWVNKVTPNYSVEKQGGTIKFVNNETQERLLCDLNAQTFIRSYKKGKDRQVRYPAQFFKYVSGRALASKIAEGDCQNFKTLVELVANNYYTCRNFGTFLVKMFDHKHLESYIAAGAKFDFNIPFAYNDFSKDIRNKLNAEGVYYSNDVGSLFCSEKDTGRAVFAQIKDCKGFKNMVTLLAQNIQPLNTLVNHYNYDLKTLFTYCRKREWKSGMRTYNYYGAGAKNVNPEEEAEQAINIYYYDIISTLRDYSRMALDVYGANYEKYPENLKEAHDEVSKLHRERAVTINAQKFVDTIDKTLEWKSKEFVVVYPKTADEVVEEGKRLRHCVGSYIQSVVNGECKILFLRKKDEVDSPYVTIEISGGNIRQARGYANASPQYDARMALKDYAKEKKLMYNK